MSGPMGPIHPRCCTRCGKKFSACMLPNPTPDFQGPKRLLVDPDEPDLAAGVIDLDADTVTCFMCMDELP